MKMSLNPIQADIMRLAQTRDIGSMSLRQIGGQIGGEHPYAVQLAIKRLVRDGLLIENKRTKSLAPSNATRSAGTLLNIPILGRVSCGIPTELADGGPRGFLSVSPSLVDSKHIKETFALIAAGDSMNLASINNKSVDDGDYVIVRKTGGVASEKQYVVSRIDDAYSLKKLSVDQLNNRIVLLPESTEQYPPIFIAEEDLEYYAIEGIAIDVVKAA